MKLNKGATRKQDSEKIVNGRPYKIKGDTAEGPLREVEKRGQPFETTQQNDVGRGSSNI